MDFAGPFLLILFLMLVIVRIDDNTGMPTMEHTLHMLLRKATNITLPMDVYEQAKKLGLNLSRACEQALRGAIRAEQERRWAVEHAAFIEAHNAFVEKNGLPLDEHRMF
jgi:antitoxin CcdA